MAGWMKTPLGTEVDLGLCHIVLNGKVVQQPPLFSAHDYCGHGRPSQLLLSSCKIFTLHGSLCLKYKLDNNMMMNELPKRRFTCFTVEEN